MDVDPELDYPDYRSTALRAPKRPLVTLPESEHDLASPVYGDGSIGELDNDLTRQHDGEPQGERILVTGRVLEEDGRPVRSALIELWQANAAGRYRFVTVKPGAYPWKNHPNAWRPAHIHFSLFGRAFSQRLVTQMYFPGDPLFAFDPIFQSVRDPHARQRLIADFDLDLTRPDWALGYRFDIVLRSTPFE